MIRFICESVFTCPEGAKEGVKYTTFTDSEELEAWLGGLNSYETRTLVGCKLISLGDNKEIEECQIK